MKKIPTLFDRDWGSKRKHVVPILLPQCVNVVETACIPTRKWDGTPCLIRRDEGGKPSIYKRFDAREGRSIPAGFEPAQESPDPETGHWPGWLPCDELDPADRYFLEALRDESWMLPEAADQIGTYELVGPKVNGNPEGLDEHRLVRHGADRLYGLPRPPVGNSNDPQLVELWFARLREWLAEADVEGIVWWSEAKWEPVAKLKRRDFGLAWPPARITV